MKSFFTNFSNTLYELENMFTHYSLTNAGYKGEDGGVPIQIVYLGGDNYVKKMYSWGDRIIMIMEFSEEGVFITPIKKDEDNG